MVLYHGERVGEEEKGGERGRRWAAEATALPQVAGRGGGGDGAAAAGPRLRRVGGLGQVEAGREEGRRGGFQGVDTAASQGGATAAGQGGLQEAAEAAAKAAAAAAATAAAAETRGDVARTRIGRGKIAVTLFVVSLSSPTCLTSLHQHQSYLPKHQKNTLTIVIRTVLV